MFSHEYEIVREFPHYFLDYQGMTVLPRKMNVGQTVSFPVLSIGVATFAIFTSAYTTGLRRILKCLLNWRVQIALTTPPLHKALREALANALIHADYYNRRGLVIQKRPDKIRIANPGAFRINVQEALVGGVSDPRNESLIKMFNLINVGERAGSGLPSISTVWQKQGWQEPEIVESFNPDRTTLVLPLAANKVAAKNGGMSSSISEKRKNDILQYLTDTPEASSTQIADAIGLQVSRTKMHLTELVSDGAVVAEGSSRARKYRLKS